MWSIAPTPTFSATLTGSRMNSWNIGAISRCHSSRSISRRSVPSISTEPESGG